MPARTWVAVLYRLVGWVAVLGVGLVAIADALGVGLPLEIVAEAVGATVAAVPEPPPVGALDATVVTIVAVDMAAAADVAVVAAAERIVAGWYEAGLAATYDGSDQAVAHVETNTLYASGKNAATRRLSRLLSFQ
ncbi:hypothetical protein B0O80DRAFT_428444 [Mortierella sp. GBAus27b]|nr:hypothetical protein B0O80DRAFT_428444 [Mortierella sp. GBAus27b]